MIKTILGLDLAVASSGWAVVGSGIETGLIITKRVKNRAGQLEWLDRQRFSQIGKQFDDLFKKIEAPDLIVLEEAFMSSESPKAGDQIREVHGVVKRCMGDAGYDCPVLTVHNRTLKRLVTGNGKAEKEEMQAAIEKVTGEHFSHDEADAVALAKVGLAVGEFDINCRRCWGRGHTGKGECTACDGSGFGEPDIVKLVDLLNPYVDGKRGKEPTNIKLHELILNEFGMTVEGLKESKRLATNAKARKDRAKAKVLKMKSTKEVQE